MFFIELFNALFYYLNYVYPALKDNHFTLQN